MPLKTLIVIALRLFTIFWLVENISACLTLIPVMMGMEAPALSRSIFYYYLMAPLGIFFIAGILWISTFRLSAQVTKGHDTELAFTSLTKDDLYCFAFVFLGIFFALLTIDSTLQSGYRFFAYDFPQPMSNPEKGRYLYPFLGHALTMIAGFACVFGARKWTNKLIRLDNKHEAPPPAG